jgi:hypothetical protein
MPYMTNIHDHQAPVELNLQVIGQHLLGSAPRGRRNRSSAVTRILANPRRPSRLSSHLTLPAGLVNLGMAQPAVIRKRRPLRWGRLVPSLLSAVS